MTNRIARRRWLQGSLAGLGITLLPLPLRAIGARADTILEQTFGDRAIREGRVDLELPALAENGNSVRMVVSAQSAMTESEHVQFMRVFAPANPNPEVAHFHFGPLSGVARVETRVRIAIEQTVVAVAGWSDGSLWSGAAQIVVTEAACLDALI